MGLGLNSGQPLRWEAEPAGGLADKTSSEDGGWVRLRDDRVAGWFGGSLPEKSDGGRLGTNQFTEGDAWGAADTRTEPSNTRHASLETLASWDNEQQISSSEIALSFYQKQLGTIPTILHCQRRWGGESGSAHTTACLSIPPPPPFSPRKSRSLHVGEEEMCGCGSSLISHMKLV